MPEHLLLPDPQPVGSRRTGGGGGSAPKRDRSRHGSRLRAQLQTVVAAPRRLNAGVDPSLVFKVRTSGRPQGRGLEGRNLQVLGETRDYTYFVLTDDQGVALAATLETYAESGAERSLVDLIDDIEPYSAQDRRGPGLDAVPPPAGTSLLVDVTIWASADLAQARQRALLVESVLTDSGSTVELRSVSARRTLLRARVTPEGLEDVLDTSVVEQVRTPPVPFLDFRDWWSVSADDFQRVEHASAVIGVLDDAPASAHPLLTDLIESIDLIAPTGYPWQQPSQHGTEIVGRALFPQLDEQLRDGSTLTAHGTVRVARILELDPNRPGAPPRFVTSGFPHEVVEQAIRRLHGQYGVKIFNLSVGYDEPYSDAHLGPLTEAIDDLIRELDIVVVVPTGNAGVQGLTALTFSGHHVADDYPAYMDTPEHRLAEPAPAALAVTVGSVALSEGVAEIGHRLGWQAVAAVDQLSPFSRTGPGIGTGADRQNKPELVHYGGNTALNDTGMVVSTDLGAGVVSTALDPANNRLFSVCNGTSFAVPPVARVAADISHSYPDASANLIRALLALSGRRPTPADDVAVVHRRAARYGLGRPDTDRAIDSGRRRATMTYDGTMDVDSVQIHPVPVPEVFRRGSGGARSLTISLVFDPPVRRQRREYLAARMQVDLYRNVEFSELQEILRQQDPDDPHGPIRDRRRPALVPGSNALLSSTVQVRSWTARNTFVDDGEVFYVAVAHRVATWARDDPNYMSQRYALAVTLEDQQLQQADLRQLLTQHIRLPARIRLRA